MTNRKKLAGMVAASIGVLCTTPSMSALLYGGMSDNPANHTTGHLGMASLDTSDFLREPTWEQDHYERYGTTGDHYWEPSTGADYEFTYNYVREPSTDWLKEDADLSRPITLRFYLVGEYDRAVKIIPRQGGNWTTMLERAGWSGGIHEYLPADVGALKPGVNSTDTTAAIGTLIENRSGAGAKNTVVTDTAIVADGSENYGGTTTLYGKVLQGSTVTNNGDITLKYRGGMTSVNGINTLWNVMDMNGDLVNNGAIKIAPVNSPTGGGEGGTQKIIGIRTNTNTTKNTGEIWVTNDSAVTATVTKGIRSGEWGATTTNEGKINVSGKTGTVNGIDSSNVINTDTGSIQAYAESQEHDASQGSSAAVRIWANNANPGSFINHGTVTGDGWASGVRIRKTDEANATATVDNYGSITGLHYAISGDGATTTVNNSGVLDGAVSLINTTGSRLNNTGTWITGADGLSEIGGTISNTGTVYVPRQGGGSDPTYTIKSALMANNGKIFVSDAEHPGNRLVIDGNYTGGKNAELILNGVLGGDDSLMDSLKITGDNGPGDTKVRVINSGGNGGQTIEGIKVIEVDGKNEGTFTQKGRTVAGAYEYYMRKLPEASTWVLTSSLIPEPSEPEQSESLPPESVHIMRPEAMAYAWNLRLANTLGLTRDEQRAGVGVYTDAITGKRETSDMWMSHQGHHVRSKDSSGQLGGQSNTYSMQLGGSVWSWKTGDDGKLALGIQGGYGHASGDSHSALTGYRTRSSLSGYSTGLYGTWREHADTQSGAYVSTSVLYGWYRNQVKGDDLAAEKYDSRGATVSLEGGYDYAIWQGGESKSDSLFIRPHAQVAWMGVKADEHREANGTRVTEQGDGNVFSRVGGRIWLDRKVSENQRVQPFVEASWLHNTRDFCSSMNGVRDCLAGDRNQAEVLAGVKGQVSPQVAVTAQAGGQFGREGSRDLSGMLNVSMKF
ncbi:autotransporter outer membrane beta-barrel domain-containing protein [Salmonella enterica]|nr:autotransporter outer membrane beta-barrel domain-containing protein [Salmonella enterica]EBL2308256.1 autotransporter outer membrane beta-barrel domain-containing protein [Salmonella enterica]